MHEILNSGITQLFKQITLKIIELTYNPLHATHLVAIKYSKLLIYFHHRQQTKFPFILLVRCIVHGYFHLTWQCVGPASFQIRNEAGPSALSAQCQVSKNEQYLWTYIIEFFDHICPWAKRQPIQIKPGPLYVQVLKLYNVFGMPIIQVKTYTSKTKTLFFTTTRQKSKTLCCVYHLLVVARNNL